MRRRRTWLNTVAWRLCVLFGHRRSSRLAEHYIDPRGRHCQRLRTFCTRCGVEGDATYEEGSLKWLSPWRALGWLRDARHVFRHWRCSDCNVCGQPFKRFGRPVGDHSACDDIPF